MQFMQYSKEGLELTKSFESCRLTAYRDIKGVLTIGYGHTGDDVTEGLTWTQNQADMQLIEDLRRAENMVNSCVTVELTQGEFDSLVDLVFNIGSGNFKTSTMLKLLNDGDYSGAANQFELWDHASGQVIAGLLRRRLAEEKEFNS
jgi:lysozyme